MESITQILEVIRNLTKADQDKLLHKLNTELTDTDCSSAQLIEIRRDQQQRNKFTCPHCKSEDVVGHGNYKGMKRYRCKGCAKTFNDLTGTAISWIHKKEKMKAYIKCLANNLTLREIAEELNISYRTSFLWRHKILGAFKDVGCTKLEGIIESDETFFLYSEKGSRNIEGRQARKRGGKATKAGISKEQVAVMVSIDRNKQPILEVAGRGRITSKQIEQCLGKWLGEKASVLCTDSHISFETFAKSKQLEHIQIKAYKGQRVKNRIYHIQNLNNTHSLLKSWIRQFNGVATGYLQNYLNWFRIQRTAGSDLVKYLNYLLTSNSAFVPVKLIKPQKFIS